MFKRDNKKIKTHYGKKGKFYDKSAIDKTGADYRIIVGERSNGKSFAVLLDFIRDYLEFNHQGAYVRRWIEDIRPRTIKTLFDNFIDNELAGNIIEKLSDGRFNSVMYRGRDFFLIRRNEEGEIEKEDLTSFCHTFALSDWEHEKSTQFPRVKKILFDEFLTRVHYLPDEYSAFNNVLSTIIRRRDDVIIYMVANTVTYDNPYAVEMGLKHFKKMAQGTIDVYEFDLNLKVAVEYCNDTSTSKASNKYFAFDNPSTRMITKGTWQTDIYPHLPERFDRSEIEFVYFIRYMGEILQCEIVEHNDSLFTFIHYKTTDVRNENDIVFDFERDMNPNHFENFMKPVNDITKNILSVYNRFPIFYQSNEVGETMRNYLIKCAS